MNTFAIPALLTAILDLMLALIAWNFRHRDRLNLYFALFTFALGMDALANYGILQARTEAAVTRWLPLLMATSVIAFAATVWFILVITGARDDLRRRVAGIPVKVFLWAAGSLGLLMLVLMLATDLFIQDIAVTPTGLKPEYGPLRPVFGLMIFLTLFYLYALLVQSLRRTQPGPFRSFLKMITVSLGIFFFSAPVFELILVQFGFLQQYLTFVAAVVSAIIFYVAILRYQFEKVEELNLTLERKVQERTRHLREAQARMIQSGKMASLGRLVAGVSHELNNPLGAMRASSETLGRAVQRLADYARPAKGSEPGEREVTRAQDAARDGVRVVQQASERIAATVRRLRAFSQLDEAELQVEHLHVLLEETLDFLRNRVGEGVTIRTDLGDLPPVLCYPADVNQVLHAVLENAVEAVGGEGEIVVRTCVERDHAVIEVRDDGAGIAPDQLDRVFDPGFTTKSRGVGTGLGLAIAYQAMERHSGMVEIDSAPGEGTRVALRFPVRRTVHSSGR